MKTPALFLCLAALAAAVLRVDAAPQTLLIDDAASRLTFDVRATMHSFTGEAADVNVEASFSEDAVPVSATVTIPTASLTTDHKARDREMLHWLEADKYPEVRYTVDRVSDGVAHGTLALHGVERPLEIPVEITHDGDTVTVDATVTIDHRDWELPQIRKFAFLTVDPEVTIHVHLVGRLQPQ